jgi:hypothetical protein
LEDSVIGVAAEASRWWGRSTSLVHHENTTLATNLNEKEGLYKSDDLREAEGAVEYFAGTPPPLQLTRREKMAPAELRRR